MRHETTVLAGIDAAADRFLSPVLPVRAVSADSRRSVGNSVRTGGRNDERNYFWEHPYGPDLCYGAVRSGAVSIAGPGHWGKPVL